MTSVAKSLTALLLTVALGVLVVGSMLYERLVRPQCGGLGAAGCPVNVVLSEIEGDVRYGAENPEYRIYLFVDLASGAARQTYQELTFALSRGRLASEVEFRLLHAPGEDCDHAGGSDSCSAAVIVECAEALAPGRGVYVVGDAFDQGWDRRPESPSLIEVAQRRVGLARPGSEASVRTCIESDRDVRDRIARHARTARSMGIRGVGGVIEVVGDPTRRASFGDWLTGQSLQRLVECLQQDACKGGT